MGAAILAGVATGKFESIQAASDSMVKIKKVYTPNPENHEVYMRQYHKFKMLFQALEPLYDYDAKKPI